MEKQTKTDSEIYIFLCLLFLANRRSRAINKKLITITNFLNMGMTYDRTRSFNILRSNAYTFILRIQILDNIGLV